MGRFDYYKSGDWNADCDVCGQKYKASKLKLRWDGLRVCPKDFEFRHPQDFVRGIRDNQSVPFSRPEPPDTFVAFNWTVYPSDNISLIEHINPTLTAQRTFSEPLSLVESIFIRVNRNQALSDSISLAESISTTIRTTSIKPLGTFSLGSEILG